MSTQPPFHEGSKVVEFSYALARPDSTRPLRPFMRRDGLPAQLLMGALARLGYAYGDPILNQPPAKRPKDPFNEPLLHIDISHLRPGDRILQVTRPPIHDLHADSMKQVERGYTDLEQRLFELWTPHFLAHCSREQMFLADEQACRLRQGYSDHGCMVFMQKGDCAPLLSVKSEPNERLRHFSGSNKTAVFLLNLPELWKGGPGYYAAFGMSGVTTLVWAYRLALDLEPLLARPGFYVYELECGVVPERETNLQWALDWKLEPMLVNEFGPGQRALLAKLP
jgi:hypothetical protein